MTDKNGANGANGVALLDPASLPVPTVEDRLAALEAENAKTTEALETLIVGTATIKWVGDMVAGVNAKIDATAAGVMEIGHAQAGLAGAVNALATQMGSLQPALDAAKGQLFDITAGLDAAAGTLQGFTEALATIQNPVTGLAVDALSLLNHLKATSEAYQTAIQMEAGFRREAKQARETLEQYENAKVAEFVVLADAGEGPLKGVAKTSKVYQTVLDAAMDAARTNDATLAGAYKAARKAELTAEEARTQMDVAREAYSAAKHASDLMGFILNAVS